MGVGKSTLAAEVARALSELFEARMSGRVRSDARLIQSRLCSMRSTQLGHPEARALPPSTKTEQVEALIAHQRRPLIVLDNFESIKDAERVRCVDFCRVAQLALCFHEQAEDRPGTQYQDSEYVARRVKRISRSVVIERRPSVSFEQLDRGVS